MTLENFAISAAMSIGQKYIVENGMEVTRTYDTLFGGKYTHDGIATTEEYLNDCSEKLGTDDLNVGLSSAFSVIGIGQSVVSLLKQEIETEYTNQEQINDAMWKLADKDENGKIDEEEYDSILNSVILGHKENAFTKTADKLNRVYELAEFQKVKDMLLEADKDLDTNGDGIFTRDEFDNSIVNHLLTNKENTEE